jgi:hypothetical protein
MGESRDLVETRRVASRPRAQLRAWKIEQVEAQNPGWEDLWEKIHG